METAGFIPKLVWRWKSHFKKRLTDLYPRAKFCFSHWSFTHRFIQWVFDDMQRTHAPIGSSLYIHRCRFPHISEAKPLIYTLKTWLNYFCISFCKEAVKEHLEILNKTPRTYNLVSTYMLLRSRIFVQLMHLH